MMNLVMSFSEERKAGFLEDTNLDGMITLPSIMQEKAHAFPTFDALISKPSHNIFTAQHFMTADERPEDKKHLYIDDYERFDIHNYTAVPSF